VGVNTALDALLAPDGVRLRADARRSAERLVAAARAALDEVGLDATTRDVARRAGVGLGTLYRRVPSLDALMAAILVDSIDEMTDLARRAREAEDAWVGFAAFAADFVQLRAASCGLNAALSGSGGGPDVAPRVARLRDAVRDLVLHTHAAGAIRADVDWVDVPFALATAIPADHTLGMAARPDQWRRNLAIVLDGLRA
jgi:AcrR family transcriptional regulator